ncbi:hypothetical protein DRJ22_05975 [Candidatus Woesearchaeota archaeon]|nr:MAG: hypothetical protein DRJ22_05975 [Candidatus Woesearchaeota archaeon]
MDEEKKMEEQSLTIKEKKLIKPRSTPLKIYPERVKAYLVLQKLLYKKNFQEIAQDINYLPRFKRYKIKTNGSRLRTMYQQLKKHRADLFERVNRCIQADDVKDIFQIEYEAVKRDALREQKRLDKQIIELDNLIEEKMPEAKFRDLTDARKKAFEQRQILEGKPTGRTDIIGLIGVEKINEWINQLKEADKISNSIKGELVEPGYKQNGGGEEEKDFGGVAGEKE